ncbi:MAG: hypothetical protein V7785_07045 [Bermanella sp.]
MVIFITSKSAFQEMQATILTLKHPVWCASDVLTLAETNELYKAGVELSVLDEEVNIETQLGIDSALEIIREHHPEQEIWVEAKD